MAKLNKTRYAVLGVLSMHPASGYDIKKFCDQGIRYFWSENFGAIYPVLKQLEEEGVVTKLVEQGEGKPPRHVYFITVSGKQELVEWLTRPVEPSPARLELLLKLTFAREVEPEVIIDELLRVQQRHQSRLAELLQLESKFVSDEPTRKSTGYPYWLATLRYGILDSKFRIQWCDETVQGIKQHFDKQGGDRV